MERMALTEMVQVRLSPLQKEELTKQAHELGMSVSALIRHSVVSLLEARKRIKQKENLNEVRN